MNKVLESFIDNMFNQLPSTDEMKKLKKNLLDHMQDKYQAYLASGKTENEAVGLVISEFGSIDEILEAYQIDMTEATSNEIKQEEIDELLTTYKKQSNIIGLAVAWIILAAGVFVALYMTFETWQYIDVVGPVSLIVALIPSIGMLVYSGIKIAPYSNRLKQPYTMTESNRQKLIHEQKVFMPQYAIKITIGVVMCMIGLSLFITGFSIEPNIYYLAAIGFLFIAVAVYMFITIGNLYGVYQIFIKNEKNASTEDKANRIIEIIAPIYWCTVIAVYLALGFIWNLWHISWVIYPIAGIIFGGIAGVTEAIYKNKK